MHARLLRHSLMADRYTRSNKCQNDYRRDSSLDGLDRAPPVERPDDPSRVSPRALGKRECATQSPALRGSWLLCPRPAALSSPSRLPAHTDGCLAAARKGSRGGKSELGWGGGRVEAGGCAGFLLIESPYVVELVGSSRSIGRPGAASDSSSTHKAKILSTRPKTGGGTVGNRWPEAVGLAVLLP